MAATATSDSTVTTPTTLSHVLLPGNVKPRFRRSALASFRAWPTAVRSGSESLRKRSWLTLSAWRRINDFNSSGRSPARGIKAPSTSTGITRIPRFSAVAISRRIKSSVLSSRRFPSSSVAVSQCLPTIEIKTSQDPTLFSNRFNKIDARRYVIDVDKNSIRRKASI